MTASQTRHKLASGWASAPPLAMLFDMVEACGGSLWLVGGAVRDALLGSAISDYDFATTLTPDETMAAARMCQFKAVPTGIAHGTITVVIDRQPFQVTTLREDIATDGRHAQVRFGSDWRRDAARRDFTINALYGERSGAVLDPFNGIADLQSGIVRFIGDPQTRIREDRLRILRFFRFFARFGRAAPHEQSYRAACAMRAGLTHLSRERICQELARLLAAQRAAAAVDAMVEGGVFAALFDFPVNAAAFRTLRSFDEVSGADPGFALLVSALFDESAGLSAHLDSRLRLSRKDSARLRKINDLAPELAPPVTRQKMLEALYKVGKEVTQDAILLAFARGCGRFELAQTRTALQLAERTKIPVLPVGGADFVSAGVTPGKKIGTALAEAERRWIASGFQARRDDLLSP